MEILTVYYAMLVAWQIIAVGGVYIHIANATAVTLALIWLGLVIAGATFLVRTTTVLPRSFLIVESVLTFFLSEASFKLIIYDNSPTLASLSVAILAIVLVLHKFFHIEIQAQVKHAWQRLTQWAKTRSWVLMRDVAAVAILFIVIWVPHHERIVALSFVGEQLHHLDFFIMAPATAWVYGGKPYVDVISQYGVGVVGLLTSLATLLGGLDYVRMVGIIIGWVIVYYVITFLFLRRWLESWLLALAALLVLFRVQMCHYGVSPLVWLYPSSTPVRFGFDICWLWLLWHFMQTKQLRWLVIAAIYSGFAPFWMSATGVCVLVTFYIFLLVLMLSRTFNRGHLCLAGIIAPVAMMTFFVMFLGKEALNSLFWKHMIEYIQFFAHGHAGGVLPLYESMKYRHWWAFAMAILMPMLYAFTVIVAICQQITTKRFDQRLTWVLIVAIYGLAQYQYFVVRSAVTSYYVASLPFVILLAWWVKIIVETQAASYRREIYAGCLLAASFALMTNHNFSAYPNMINFSTNPLVDITVAQHFPDRQGYFSHLVKNITEKDKVSVNNLGVVEEGIVREESFKTDQEVIAYARQGMDFTPEAALINKYFPRHEPVAILSSFESAILIQSKHPPMFYHTPMTSSRPMMVRIFPTDAAHSPKYLDESIHQLDHVHPIYVVMEKIFLQDKLPASYDDLPWGNITALVKHIRSNYSPIEEGRYLVVMKRNNNAL